MAKVSIGIDVMEKEIKTVSLVKAGDIYHLERYAVLSKNELYGQNVGRGNAKISFHDGSIKIRLVTVPVVPKDEVDEVVAWAFKEATKVPLEIYSLRYYPVAGALKGQQFYLVMATERKRLQEYLIELQKLGIDHPKFIEPHIQALANCVAYNYDLKADERVAIVHLDSSLGYCGTVSADGLLYYRTFSRTDGALTVDVPQFLSKIGVEVQYSCEHYIQQFPGKPATTAILSGEHAGLAGLSEAIQEITGVSVEVLDAFKKIELSDRQREELQGKAAEYGVAVGLAL